MSRNYNIAIMKIQVGEEYDKLPKIRHIQPGVLKIWVIIVFVIVSIGLAGIPFLLYMLWNGFRNLIHNLIFMKHQVNSTQTTHYLICDSFSFKDTKRSVDYRTYIVKPYYKIEKSNIEKSSSIIGDQQELSFIKHKGLKYQINGQAVSQLKFKLSKTIQQYTTNGLDKSQIQQSRLLFGNDLSLDIPFYSIFFDIFNRRYLRFIILGLAFLKFLINQILPSQQYGRQPSINHFLVPIIAAIVFLGSFCLSISGSHANKTSNSCLQQCQFNVIRQGNGLNLKLKQIIVGDIIKLKQNQIIWFKGIYVTEKKSRTFMILNTSLNDRSESPMVKVPLLHSLHQITDLNIVEPGSQIMGLDHQANSTIESNISQSQGKGNHYLIVTQIDYIQKFYSEYSSFKTYANYGPYRSQYDMQTLTFAAINFIILFSMYLVLFILKKTEFQIQIAIDFMLTLVVFMFPFEAQFFNFCSTLISIIRLKLNDAKVIRPIIEQIGLVETICADLNIFKQTQFDGFLKKERSFGLQMPNKLKNCQQWIQTYRKTRSESTFAFFLYCAAMNADRLNSDRIAKHLFDFFHFEFTNQQDFGQTRIKNEQFWKVCKINWRIIRRFQLSNKFQRSVLVKDQFDNTYILIMEGYYVHDGCDQYFKSSVIQKRAQYLKTMKHYLEKGKVVRYLCYKKNITQNQLQNDIQSRDFHRTLLQKNLIYAGLVVYDQWPNLQSLQLMQAISASSSQKKPSLQTFFISNSQESQIFGFDHQFQDRNFLYDQSSAERTKFLRQAKMNKALMHFGKGILDQAALLVADISVQFQTQSPSQSDILINNRASIGNILQQGRWNLQTLKLSIVFLTISNFCHLFGVGINYLLQNKLDLQKTTFMYIFGMVFPSIFLNLYSPTKLNTFFQKRFLNFNLILNLLISVMSLFTFYLIMWTDINAICSKPLYNIRFQNNLRNFHHQNSKEAKTEVFDQNCGFLADFVTLSVSLLLIIILDRQSYARQAGIMLRHINKVYMLIIWIVGIIILNISARIASKVGITILILSVLVYLFLWLKSDSTKANDKVVQAILAEQNQINFQQTRL